MAANQPIPLEAYFSCPLKAGWTGRVLLGEIKAALADLTRHVAGPFLVQHTPDWDRFLDSDFPSLDLTAGPVYTVRQRLRIIRGVRDVRRTYREDPYGEFMILFTLGEDQKPERRKLPDGRERYVYEGPRGVDVLRATGIMV